MRNTLFGVQLCTRSTRRLLVVCVPVTKWHVQALCDYVIKR